MSGNRSLDLVSYARELEQRDADVAARIDAVTEVLSDVDDLRARARLVQASLEALPVEREHAELAVQNAQERETAALMELADAERQLEEVARSRRPAAEAKARAEQAVRRTTVAAADAADATARLRDRVEATVADEIALRAQAEGLVAELAELTRRVSEVPRLSDSGRSAPGTSLAEIDEWGARAHAALFVVRGGLESEREKVVLEAHALAAAALGEQTAGASVALVRRRLEESLAQG
jgi:chromosome segregation ATPase